MREIIIPISLAYFMQTILYLLYIQYATMYSSVIITKAIVKMNAVVQYKESI